MTERLPTPRPAAFPELSADPEWVRRLPGGTMFARIYKSAGAYSTDWHVFREYGPLDARFDPHPEPTGQHDGHGVMYAVLADRADLADRAQSADRAGSARGADRTADETEQGSVGAESGARSSRALDSAFSACLLEVFQQYRIIRRADGAPIIAAFETREELRLLDLSDSDWISVAGGNAAISSGEREHAREWSRAIRDRYPNLDGVISASSIVPTARVVALWSPAAPKLARNPLALLRLDRPELTELIDAVAERYGYLVL